LSEAKRAWDAVILVINKIDEIPKEKILEVISSYKEIYDFESIIPISAKYADGVGVIEEKIISLMPEGPQFYPQDMITTSRKGI
jgi:GTP-binding protein Era